MEVGVDVYTKPSPTEPYWKNKCGSSLDHEASLVFLCVSG